LRFRSQYRAVRSLTPTALANCFCVRPARIRAAFNWRPLTKLEKGSGIHRSFVLLLKTPGVDVSLFGCNFGCIWCQPLGTLSPDTALLDRCLSKMRSFDGRLYTGPYRLLLLGNGSIRMGKEGDCSPSLPFLERIGTSAIGPVERARYSRLRRVKAYRRIGQHRIAIHAR